METVSKLALGLRNAKRIKLGSVAVATLLSGVPLLMASAHADEMYVNLSSYANNNIFTDLNQNFPNTGPGMPGSHTGTANSTFLFTPGSYTPPAATSSSSPEYTITSYTVVNDGPSNGVSFQLNSNAGGQDFAQIGTSGPAGYTGPNPLTVTTNVTNATTVYALMGAYDGQSFSATFTGADGSTETYSNIFIPDFNGGAQVNTCTGTLAPGANCVQTAYVVNDRGGGGSGNSATGDTANYDLTEVEFALNSTLSAEQLSSVTFNSNGYETLLFGLTAESPAPVPLPALPAPAVLVLLGAAVAGLELKGRRKDT